MNSRATVIAVALITSAFFAALLAALLPSLRSEVLWTVAGLSVLEFSGLAVWVVAQRRKGSRRSDPPGS